MAREVWRVEMRSGLAYRWSLSGEFDRRSEAVNHRDMMERLQPEATIRVILRKKSES